MSTLNPFEDLTKITFADCKLDREKYADVLTDIVRTNPNGFVLAIDNKWGTGKTTFVNMWRNKLQDNDAYKTLYFNAWENDFENNPFVAITAELKGLIGKEKSETYKKVLEKGSKITQIILPSLLKSALKKYLGEDAANIMGDTAEGTFNAFEKDIEAYVERKQNIKDFHERLEEYFFENSNGKPVVFIIDELDRCRPDYAVSVLENIKHLFSVKGIVFVLSIDKEQLGHAVCGVYGSDNIDANEYLRRFIDVEYSLPNPELKSYVDYLIELHKLNDFFEIDFREKNLLYETYKFREITVFLFKLRGLTLRQQEKVIRHISITLRSFDKNAIIIPIILIYLVYLRLFYKNIYFQIKNKELTHQELIDKIKETLTGILNQYKQNKLRINIESFMLLFYNEYLDRDEQLIGISNFEKEDDLIIRSNFDTTQDQTTFKHYLIRERSNYRGNRIPIDYLLNKIDLMEPLKDL